MEAISCPFTRNPNPDRRHRRWLVAAFHHPWGMVESRILEGHHRRYFCRALRLNIHRFPMQHLDYMPSSLA